MLRKIRITLAAIFITGITLLFLDFTGILHSWLGWMANIQFLPAMLAANAVVVAILILVTVLFGRIYCSVICPLGVMQDIISWIHGRTRKKNRFRFRYTPERKWLRYAFLAGFIGLLAAGLHSLAALIAPYSAYGRMVSNLTAPTSAPLTTLIVSVVTFVVIFIMAWRGGRQYCNTVCPVGTILGFFSRRSIFAPVIDTEKCRNCGLCGRQCKSSCIDMANHSIDYSRCVSCMDCLDTCTEGAIHYTNRFARGGNPPADRTCNTDIEQRKDGVDRRAFITTVALTGTAIAVNSYRQKIGSTKPDRHLVPAGAVSLKNLTDHCTACQLCVSACPYNILQPSSSLTSLMQPEMSYKRGWCRPECTKCSEVCPTGAIRPISVEKKASIRIGYVVVDPGSCLSCSICALNCPVGAISMLPKTTEDKSSVAIPTVDTQKCIGCGACEHHCPATPVPAIHIEGYPAHINASHK